MPVPESSAPPASEGFKPVSPLLKTLCERGLVFQMTDARGLDALAAEGPLTAYIGFDATAPSLHVGSLVQIMLLRWLRHHGHKVIAVVGGATTRVGDPTGKEESRPLLDEADIIGNARLISQTLQAFLGQESGEDGSFCVLDNHDWIRSVTWLDLLRKYGRHLSVNRMLGFESIRQRLAREQHLSFLEFNYMVLQAVDFVTLAQTRGCRLQAGGADQWGNIVCGVDLGRKMGGVPPLFGLTTPLLTTAQGHKMGKTAAGAVWLSAERLAPSGYWQFWRNTDDADVERFLLLFTSLPADEIRRIVHNEEINRQKIILADQATALCHGLDVLPAIHGKVGRFFGSADLQADEHPACVPDLVLDAGESSTPVTALLVRLGWAASTSEARRLVRQGAVHCGDKPVTDETVRIAELVGSRPVFALSAGRKRHALVQVQAEEKEGRH